MRTVCTSITEDIFKTFKERCVSLGYSVYSCLKKLIECFMAENCIIEPARPAGAKTMQTLSDRIRVVEEKLDQIMEILGRIGETTSKEQPDSKHRESGRQQDILKRFFAE